MFYVSSVTDTTWQRVGSVRWTRRGRITLTATATFPPGGLGSCD